MEIPAAIDRWSSLGDRPGRAEGGCTHGGERSGARRRVQDKSWGLWEGEKPRRAPRSPQKRQLGRAQLAALLVGAGSHRPPGNGSVRAVGISQTAATLRRCDALEGRPKTSPLCSVGWDAAWRAGQRPGPAPCPPLPPTLAGWRGAWGHNLLQQLTKQPSRRAVALAGKQAGEARGVGGN